MNEKVEKVENNEIICLNITSWAGLPIGAEHYYANFHEYDCLIEDKEITLKRVITEVSEARYLSKKLGYKGIIKVGDKTDCFSTECQLRQEARKQYKKHYSKAKVILLSDRGCYGIHEILLGPRVFKKLNNKLWKEFEKLWTLQRNRVITEDQRFEAEEVLKKQLKKFWP
ncbi:MAG: hypothetical protein J7L15_06325 [Clostridiales bacterium]|nr:hypothetical protein [Clostridiales bacterium]